MIERGTIYWLEKMIAFMRWLTPRRDWLYILNGDGSITSYKVPQL